MKNLRQLLRRSGWFVSKKRRGRPDNINGSRRRLSNEALEKRELLAGDVLASSFDHNTWAPYDVNRDGQYSASDALAVINFMGRNRSLDAANDADGVQPMEPHAAIGAAVRSRVRPIFMGMFTSVGGMAPLVLMPGSGSEQIQQKFYAGD